jgi:hypothetical protein
MLPLGSITAALFRLGEFSLPRLSQAINTLSGIHLKSGRDFPEICATTSSARAMVVLFTCTAARA